MSEIPFLTSPIIAVLLYHPTNFCIDSKEVWLYDEDYHKRMLLTPEAKVEILNPLDYGTYYKVNVQIGDRRIKGHVLQSDVIVWYGEDEASLNLFDKRYFDGFFDKPQGFLRLNNSNRRKNAAARVMLKRYDEIHDNPKHREVFVYGSYDEAMVEAVKIAQNHFDIIEDGKFGKKTYEHLRAFFIRYSLPLD